MITNYKSCYAILKLSKSQKNPPLYAQNGINYSFVLLHCMMRYICGRIVKQGIWCEWVTVIEEIVLEMQQTY